MTIELLPLLILTSTMLDAPLCMACFRNAIIPVSPHDQDLFNDNDDTDYNNNIDDGK